jgi:hypothetical protein
VADSSPLVPDFETLRMAMDRLGVDHLNDAWLERLSTELSALVEMGRKLDEMDLSDEEPASIFINREG